MTGTIINASVILIMGILGTFLGKGIPERIKDSITLGLGILIIAVGIEYILGAENAAVVALSMALGIALGETADLEGKINHFGMLVQKKITQNKTSQLGKAFVSASLLYCVGAMGIIGSITDGLTGNYQILVLKSVLDGIFSFVLSASMGIGVVLSAFPVFIYQGSISLAAASLQNILNDVLMSNITALGGIMIAGIGFNMMKLAHIKVSNMLPSLLCLAPVMYLYALLPLE